jgi:hypothetical protein
MITRTKISIGVFVLAYLSIFCLGQGSGDMATWCQEITQEGDKAEEVGKRFASRYLPGYRFCKVGEPGSPGFSFLVVDPQKRVNSAVQSTSRSYHGAEGYELRFLRDARIKVNDRAEAKKAALLVLELLSEAFERDLDADDFQIQEKNGEIRIESETEDGYLRLMVKDKRIQKAEIFLKHQHIQQQQQLELQQQKMKGPIRGPEMRVVG